MGESMSTTDLPLDPDGELLSQLLDGELAPEAEAALRARIAREPSLAARLEALAAVDRELAALPLPELRPELRAGLARRIAALAADDSGARDTSSSVDPRPRLRAAWAAAGAIAAALALYLALARAPVARAPEFAADLPARPLPPIADAERPGVAPDSAPAPIAATPARSLAPEPSALAAAKERESAPDLAPPSPAVADVAAPTPEEIAIASELEVLRDFDAIDQLELLELLALLDAGGSSG